MTEQKNPYEWLARHATGVYSQFGEAGILDAIFNRIGTKNKWCCELGAADGLLFSNTRHLIEGGWHAVLLEADEKLFGQLAENNAQFIENKQVTLGNYKVEPEGHTSLDVLLEKFGAPQDLDLLSIDCDGPDYYLWNSLHKFKPRVVVIEYDPNKAGVDIPPLGDYSKGQASLEAILYVGNAKGYTPVGRTRTNVIFVQNTSAGLLHNEGAVQEGGKDGEIRIAALMSVPRYGATASRGVIERALRPFGIPLNTFSGVFWGQCMQRAIEGYIEDGVDWVLTVDYDSLFSAEQLDRAIGIFGQRADIDALAPLQCRRGMKYPLMTVRGELGVTVSNEPIKVDTAHFGMTLIRLDALKDIPKPWFFAKPDDNGEWGDDRLDDDIWFWHQWRTHGKTLYVAPSVSIGHLEEVAAVFDDDFQPKHIYVKEWLQQHCPEVKVG